MGVAVGIADIVGAAVDNAGGVADTAAVVAAVRCTVGEDLFALGSAELVPPQKDAAKAQASHKQMLVAGPGM